LAPLGHLDLKAMRINQLRYDTAFNLYYLPSNAALAVRGRRFEFRHRQWSRFGNPHFYFGQSDGSSLRSLRSCNHWLFDCLQCSHSMRQAQIRIERTSPIDAKADFFRREAASEGNVGCREFQAAVERPPLIAASSTLRKGARYTEIISSRQSSRR